MSENADDKAGSPKTTSAGALQTAGGGGVPDEPLDLLPEEPTIKGVEPKRIVGRSPGQLAWIRLKRDRVALVSAIVMFLFALVALLAPVIEILYGDSPTAQHPELIDIADGQPLGYPGGISADHWLGVEPGNGRDILLQLVYGARTSLGIALAAAIFSTTIGVIIGIVAAYFGGWVDSVLSWFTDFMLAFPFLLFCLAAIPVLNLAIADDQGVVSTEKRIATIIGVFAVFGWMSTARLVRGQVLSLREREFVEAARAAGAGSGHILFRQLLPNLWAPILVTVSLGVPQLVTAEAALSFLNIGVIEPTPDWGRMIFGSINYLQTDPLFTLFPGLSIFILVLAFNLFGDSLRDALDPKSLR